VAIGKPILEKSSQGQKRSTTQILTLSDPKIRGQEPKTLSKRAHNSLLEEAGLTMIPIGKSEPLSIVRGEPPDLSSILVSPSEAPF
jgi:hypothetical protein